ncbi:hypothetical protein [Candidatus Amarolinea dominans]|uniref:hypothetical protein n=1 Tax=Candidatus Amarolinea dominans TaxID=3140696 RepID=UPI0031CC89E1
MTAMSAGRSASSPNSTAKVDAFGVGGVELYLRLEDREYPLRSGLSLIRNVHKTWP